MSDDFLKDIQQSFLVEACENLAQTESLFLSLEKPDVDHHETFVQLKRLAHNFKGSGKAVSFDELSRFSHSLENLLIALSSGAIKLTPAIVDLLLTCNDTLRTDLETLKANTEAKIDHQDMIDHLEDLVKTASDSNPEISSSENGEPTSPVPLFNKPFIKSKEVPVVPPPTVAADDHVRIPMKRIEELFNSFGEQVIYLSALEHYKNDMINNLDNIERTLFNLKKITYELQQSTLSLRMVGLKGLFAKLERAVRDVSRVTNKPVHFITTGLNQELDKTIVDQISDPLTHMVRNAVDHGIESQEERMQKSKPEVGSICIDAYRESGSFFIIIKDDGKGLDPAFIRRKAIEKGLITSEAVLSEKETFDLLFEPGFSTKEQVSEISGRGVGMNVVKEMIQNLGGQLDIKSEINQGTTFKIKLPLSLSLFNGLCFTVNGQRYIVPSSQVIEVVDCSQVEIRDINDAKMRLVQVRDSVHCLLDLRSVFRNHLNGEEASRRKMILITEVDGEKICFQIHQVSGIVRVVQKPIGNEVASCPGAVGVTILGDGSPTLVLDFRQLVAELRPTQRGLTA